MTETITIGCTIPNGVHLRVSSFVTRTVADDEFGSKKVVVPIEAGIIELKGPNSMHRPHKQPEQYAATPGVDKTLWDAWFEENQFSNMVKNRAVFVVDEARG